jgi:Brp/Blh family beta-carotene 15,15'-monooxygenase
LIPLAILIVLLGVPHGALDTVFAQRLHGVRGVAGWCVFTLAYLALMALVAGLWKVVPALFMIGFLVVSALHFSGDPVIGTPVLSRLLYGGAILILPALLHEQEMRRLFAFLIPPDTAGSLVQWLHAMSWPWLAGTLTAAAISAKKDWLTGLELLATALLALLASPLVAFVIFFCSMHSPRHILRTWRYAGSVPAAQLIKASALPLLGTLIIFTAAAFSLRDLSIESAVMQLVFIGLAALTVPHMVLVEQVRFSGWEK